MRGSGGDLLRKIASPQAIGRGGEVVEGRILHLVRRADPLESLPHTSVPESEGVVRHRGRRLSNELRVLCQRRV